MLPTSPPCARFTAQHTRSTASLTRSTVDRRRGIGKTEHPEPFPFEQASAFSPLTGHRTMGRRPSAPHRRLTSPDVSQPSTVAAAHGENRNTRKTNRGELSPSSRPSACFGLGSSNYGRNTGTGSVNPSFTASSNGYEGNYAEPYGSSSIYGDTTWRSASLELDGSGPFSYGLGNAASDGTAKASSDYMGGYNITNRQTNRGIAA